MKTIADRFSSSSPNRAAWLAACAGVVALGAVTLGGCAAAKSGPDYHGDIDHNGQPFDGFSITGSKSSATGSSDARSGDVQCDHEKNH